MEKGYFLTSGEELTNPNLKYESARDYIALGSND